MEKKGNKKMEMGIKGNEKRDEEERVVSWRRTELRWRGIRETRK